MAKEKDFRPNLPPLTAEYVPSVSRATDSAFFRVPPFTFQVINWMLADFRIRWGLWLLKGPILCKSKFFVKCDNPEVKEFLVDQITRFWRTSAMRAMKAFEFGYSCSEVVYKTEEGNIQFDYLKDLQAVDCKALTIKGSVAGALVDKVPKVGKLILGGPKKFWHIHNREYHPYYGCSRLYGSYMPWIEIWGPNGYRDSRKLYFHKYAYSGGGIYVPQGKSQTGTDPSGAPSYTDNWILGRQMVEALKSGGVWTLPGTMDENGNRLWERVSPDVTSPPTNLMEYGETLKDEEWEGMGIPPEIARAEGTGAFAGRAVPLMGFYTTLQELVYWLIHDADEQIFRELVDYRFGEGVAYEIIPFSLMDEALKDEKGTEGEGQPMQLPQQGQAGLPQNPVQKGLQLSQNLSLEEVGQRLHEFLISSAIQAQTLGNPPGTWTVAV